MKRIILGEAQDILAILPSDQLKAFDRMRHDKAVWEPLQQFCYDQKQIKLDCMYRLRRPKTQDEVIKNAIEHEYYAARIASLVVLLQVMENAAGELERRERKTT